jgi:hypothetical protein
MADAVTIWIIVMLVNGAHRVVLPQEFDDEKKCISAAEQINAQDARSAASCVPKGSR